VGDLSQNIGNIGGVRPTQRSEGTQAGVYLSSDQIEDYKARIRQVQTSPAERFTEIPATLGRLNPDAAAQDPTPINRQIIQEAAQAPDPSNSTAGIEQLAGNLQVIYALLPQARPLARQAAAEQRLVGGKA